MKSLPLVQLSLLRPVVFALREQGYDPETVLESVGLTEDAVMHGDETVHVMVVHQFLEACAVAVEDKTFCTTVGARLDPAGWPMIESGLASGCSLADFLSVYVIGASSVASSVTAYLDIRGARAIYGETRLFRPTILPAQNDGFMVGLAISILRRALGDQLDTKKMTLVLCDPSVLPTSFSQYTRLKGDEMGFRIEFPSSWLVYSLQGDATAKQEIEAGRFSEVTTFLSDLRVLISRRIGEGGLTADQVAELVSMSRSTLSRRLAKEGTSISTELKHARLACARQWLSETDKSVDKIAADLGYADPSNFTRAFRKAEGLNPRLFRSKAYADPEKH